MTKPINIDVTDFCTLFNRNVTIKVKYLPKPNSSVKKVINADCPHLYDCGVASGPPSSNPSFNHSICSIRSILRIHGIT